MKPKFAQSTKQAYPWPRRQALRWWARIATPWLHSSHRWLENAAGTPRVQILRFRHVFHDEVGPFRGLLRQLARYYRFVSYREAVSRIQTGQIDDAYLAISFDGGLRCCLEAAAVMGEMGIRGCFFVPTAILDRRPSDNLRWFFHKRLGLAPCELLRWSDLAALQYNGHEIGGQTIHYDDLAKLPRYLAHHEIFMCREILLRRCGPVHHFAWPFGHWRHFTELAASTVFDIGFTSCASAMGGAHVRCQPARVATGSFRASPSSMRIGQQTLNLCVRREPMIAALPFGLIATQLGRMALRATPVDRLWPKDWNVAAPWSHESAHVLRDVA